MLVQKINLMTSLFHPLKYPAFCLKAGIVLLVFYFFSCRRYEAKQKLENTGKEEWMMRVCSKHLSADSLNILLEKCVNEGDEIAVSVLCKELGQRMRESSDLPKAIEYHRQGLAAAYRIKDTIEITQALNNMGTDYRRIGALPEAFDYHFQALQMADVFSDRDGAAGRKNRVMAMNGIGNVYLSFYNYDEAEKMFREALAEEKILNSAVGQAINYANIGAIFEKRGMYDSAFVYYRYSMEHNVVAGSQLGMGLCRIYFGQIYELRQEYDKAEQEYGQAYRIMENITDTWHWLEACLAIARIKLFKNDFAESKKYLDLAREASLDIRSSQHLSQTYGLLHEYHLKQGRFAEALSDFKLSKAYQDSVQDIRKLNRLTDMRMNFERDKSRQHIAQLNLRKEMEARQNKIILMASVLFAILLIFLLITLFYAYVQRTKSNLILLKISRIRTNFFTNVTHQFRTPLTVILGLSQHLQTRKNITQAETNHYLKAINRQGSDLLALVNQLLNMAKINAGIDNPEWKRGNIVAYVQMTVESFRLYAQSNNLRLLFSADELNIEVDFVPYYIRDVLQNLLSNAIKFSCPGGEIAVSVSTNRNREVELKITDTGSGISEEEKEQIFELFYQSLRYEKQGGSGIGLNYTRQLVETMHGTISVKSQEGNGSVFTVTLPLRQPGNPVLPAWSVCEENLRLKDAAEENKNPIPEIFEEDFRGNSIPPDIRNSLLLVEDSNDAVLYIKTLLPPGKYNVVTARNGSEAFEVANRMVPDIIVSDIMMPGGKDGLDLCRDIRSSELLSHIPVILLTAKSSTDDRLMGLKTGADAYICKPFYPEELLVRIETLLENRRLLKEKYMRSLLKGDAFPEKDANMEFLQKVTDMVYREMRNPLLSPTLLATHLGMSVSQLNRKLTALSGHTSLNYIMNLRIDRAKKKLASENGSVGQIAEACGFYDATYFSRLFKKHTGVTPSQYRRIPK